MSASSILFIFIFLVLLLIFIEYRNEQKYQKKRRERRPKSTLKKPKEPIKKRHKAKKKPQEEPKPQIEKEVEEVQPEEEPEPKFEPKEVIEEKPEEVEEVQPEVVVEEVEEIKKLPTCKYPAFTHVRLVEMGLSDDEATEFVHELIPQLEAEVPLLEEAINNADLLKIERLTHGIKGSASNLGTGGVSDLLIEFNTYLKDGTDTDILKAYQKHFVHYIQELKKQYT